MRKVEVEKQQLTEEHERKEEEIRKLNEVISNQSKTVSVKDSEVKRLAKEIETAKEVTGNLSKEVASQKNLLEVLKAYCCSSYYLELFMKYSVLP